jgi:D-arabinose 1-dehydrogenase-like Zn-dependent alcohol dehydrogenase
MKALVSALGRGCDFEDIDIAAAAAWGALIDVGASGFCYIDLWFATREIVPTPAGLRHEGQDA